MDYYEQHYNELTNEIIRLRQVIKSLKEERDRYFKDTTYLQITVNDLNNQLRMHNIIPKPVNYDKYLK
jgi:hypothetical protein